MKTEIDGRYSDPDASALPWDDGLAALTSAQLYWLTTVRTDGRPHQTPLIGAWCDEAMWITTGADEQKARNLAQNPHVVVSTGRNDLHTGLDLVVEGDAVLASDEQLLQRVADAFLAKYGEEWHFTVADGAFTHVRGEHSADVYRIAPATVYGFSKDPYRHTRWTFED